MTLAGEEGEERAELTEAREQGGLRGKGAEGPPAWPAPLQGLAPWARAGHPKGHRGPGAGAEPRPPGPRLSFSRHVSWFVRKKTKQNKTCFIP